MFLLVLNNDSVVLRLYQSSRSVLVTGDVVVELGSVNMAWSKSLRSSTLKVAHDGSETSPQSLFVKAVDRSWL